MKATTGITRTNRLVCPWRDAVAELGPRIRSVQPLNAKRCVR